MRWYTTWWSIVIEPECKDDKLMLDALMERLPVTADGSYEDGTWEWLEGQEVQYWADGDYQYRNVDALVMRR